MNSWQQSTQIKMILNNAAKSRKIIQIDLLETNKKARLTGPQHILYTVYTGCDKKG